MNLSEIKDKVETLYSLAEKQKEGKEDINLFSILKLQAKETRHSMIIAELLNPNGTHNCNDEFLKKFLGIVDIPDFPADTVTVNTEESYGSKGRVDIIMKSGEYKESEKSAIIIENKIYAGDQPAQLERYDEIGKRFKNCQILYLTLNGKEASLGSTCEMESNKYKRISYRYHIKKWLESCLDSEILSSKPRVKDIIQQYLEIVKIITRQDMELSLEQIIDELSKKPNDIKSYIKFRDELTSVLNCVNGNFENCITECLEDKNVRKEAEWPSWKLEFENEKVRFIQLYIDNDGSIYCGGGLQEERPKLEESWIKDSNEPNAYYKKFDPTPEGYENAVNFFKELKENKDLM